MGRGRRGAHLLPLPLSAVSCRGAFRSGAGRKYPGAMQAAGAVRLLRLLFPPQVGLSLRKEALIAQEVFLG